MKNAEQILLDVRIAYGQAAELKRSVNMKPIFKGKEKASGMIKKMSYLLVVAPGERGKSILESLGIPAKQPAGSEVSQFGVGKL